MAIICLCCTSGGFAQNAAPAAAKQPVAKVAGQPIYEDDLLPLTGGEMQQLRQKEYEIKSRALENVINQKLLEAEGKKKGITAEKVLEQEVDSKIAEPSDAELEAFYLAQKDRLKQPFEEIKTQIRDGLKQGKLQQARQNYLQRLWRESDVAILLSSPKLQLSYDPARVRGDSKAAVVIIEFSDFECPFCQTAYPVMKQMLTKYSGKIRLAYRDFPLRQIHPHAEAAAEASRCATEQGKFWEYHDLLFSNPGKLDNAALDEYARSLQLDKELFESCLSSGKFKAGVEDDLQAGLKAGVSGTPAFFINGTLVTGAQPAAVFEKAIEQELAAASH